MREAIRIALILVAGAVSSAASADQAQDRARLEALKSEIAAVKSRIERRAGERDKLQEALRERELAIADVSRRVARLQEESAQLKRELDSLIDRQAQLEEKSARQRERIARELTTAYRLGQAEPVKLLLNQEDPNQLARTLKYYEYFLEARSANLARYRETLDELTDVASRIRSRQDTLTAKREDLGRQKTELEREQGRRREVLARLNRELGSDKSRLSRLKKERSQLEEVLTALEEAVRGMSSPGKPFPESKGALPWPLSGRVLHAFGGQRAANLPWTGWLLDASEGEPVHSIHNGRVVFSDYLRGHGLVLIIDHGKGYLSLYAHNQVLLAETGEWVRAGQTIARAGRSGGLTESALYFEIRHNGRPQDPKVWLASRR